MGGLTAGIDEVGRGPLAGPVIAAAVILCQPIDGLTDSKLLSARKRERLARSIRRHAIWALGAASVREIDQINIREATFLAMRRAVARLDQRPSQALVDGNADPGLGFPTRCIVKGDLLEPAIGAASIIAKVCRDRLMARLAVRYPGYGWEHNAGYGTVIHRDGLIEHGVSDHHRRSFAPVRLLLEADPPPGA